MTDTDRDQLLYRYRTALESLRSGVPNRTAVEILGINESRAKSEFERLLDPSSGVRQGPQSMLISGEFGAGKSHILEYCKHLALSKNYVCSMVAVSKEMPFDKPEKVFKAAIDNGIVPCMDGQNKSEIAVSQMVHEVSNKLDTRNDKYEKFSRWAHSEQTLHKIFPATLTIHGEQSTKDDEIRHKIQSFWSGNRITQKDVRDGLRAIRKHQAYQFKNTKAEPSQRLRFVLELIKAAGYTGWVILIDELELIASYSIRQRGKSYAELARWMGLTQDEEYPGMVVAGTITESFEDKIINENERGKVSRKLREKGEKEIASRAEAGIDRIADRIKLEEPSKEFVRESIDKIRKIYSDAYAWDAPPLADDTSPKAGQQQMMRYKVRAAITEWDLKRLYPGAKVEIEDEEYQHSYTEDPAMAKPPSDDEETN